MFVSIDQPGTIPSEFNNTEADSDKPESHILKEAAKGELPHLAGQAGRSQRPRGQIRTASGILRSRRHQVGGWRDVDDAFAAIDTVAGFRARPNRRATQIRVLCPDRSGLCVWAKRLHFHRTSNPNYVDRMGRTQLSLNIVILLHIQPVRNCPPSVHTRY